MGVAIGQDRILYIFNQEIDWSFRVERQGMQGYMRRWWCWWYVQCSVEIGFRDVINPGDVGHSHPIADGLDIAFFCQCTFVLKTAYCPNCGMCGKDTPTEGEHKEYTC